MKQDAFINQLAKISGCSRKKVIETLKMMSGMPEVQEEIKNNKRRRVQNSR